MNMRLYFRLLHPFGLLLFGGAYIGGAAFVSGAFASAPQQHIPLLAFGLAAPLILGHFFAATAHEQINRREILLLPGGFGWMRNASIGATLITALLLTCLLAWLAPDVPSPAVFGWVAGLLTVHYPNLYRKAAGLLWPALAVCAWGLFLRVFGARLQPAMIAAPWVFLVGGLALAATGLGLGFARRYRRERSEIPYAALATHNIAALFDHEVMRRHVQQQAVRTMRAGKLRIPDGPDWRNGRVTPAVASWMRALDHGGLALRPISSFALRHARLLLGALGVLLLVPLLAIPLERVLSAREATTLADYWTHVVHYADPYAWLRLRGGPGIGFTAFIAVFGQPFLAQTVTLMTPLPQLYYPASRRHMERVIFALGLRQITAAILVSNSALILASLAGQVATGKFLSLESYAGLAVVSLVLAILLPLLLCLPFFRASFARMIYGAPLILLVGCAGAVPLFWPHLLLTPAALTLALAGIAASVAVLRWRIHVRYNRQDLTSDLNLMVTRATT